MLFGRKKYNYFSMLILYLKLVPISAITKIAINILGYILPTLNIVMTAEFLDSAIIAVEMHNKLNEVFLPLGVIILISLFNNYVALIVRMISIRAENRMRKIITPIIVEKRASIQFKYYEHQESIDIMNRAMENFEGNIQLFFDQFLELLLLVSHIVGFVVILGLQLWWASIVFVITSVPSLIISYKFGHKQYAINKEMTKIDRRVGYIFRILNSRENVEERYIYGYTNKMNGEYREKYEFARIARKKVERAGWINRKISGMLVFFSGIVIIAVLIPSAISTDNSGKVELTIGMFTALVNAVFGLSRQMQWNIPNQISQFKYKFEYLKDLNKFLEFEKDDGAICLPNANTMELNSIEFRNVSFKYPGTETYILKNFSVILKSGKHYAIVGANGAGKTTITKLLTKLYCEYEGEILINGKELHEYTQSEIKAICSVVYQDFCRYPLDFFHNIAIGNVNDIENHKIVENAVNVIGLSETVDKLSKKYKTNISKIKEDGIDMSGGEWQRIALARLIVNPAPLKILDEPTAALDPISENKIYEQFGEIVDQNNVRNNITLFISHRLGSTKLADEIIVIFEGRAAEIGTFDELIAKNGIFTKMYTSQAGWYKTASENK